MKKSDLKPGYVYKVNNNLYIFYYSICTTHNLDNFNDQELIFFKFKDKMPDKLYEEDMFKIPILFYQNLEDLNYTFEETDYVPYKINSVIIKYYTIEKRKQKLIYE